MPDFPVVFHFKVAFGRSQDEDDGRFQEVTGISAEVLVEEYREGGLNQFSYRLPTGVKFNNLVLKRGYLASTKVAEWCRKAVEDFSFDPDDVSVTLLDERHQALVQWNFVGAYPVKWALSDLKAQENAIAIESLELAYKGFRKV
jgi:phage tail-like protein